MKFSISFILTFTIGDIEEVWSFNKTPIVTDKVLLQKLTELSIIDIPSNLIEEVEEFEAFCHENGFECGEYITGKVYDTRKERCFLCEIAHYKGFTTGMLYNQFVEKTVDCIIYESPNFYVTSELGALKQGYLMIVPKEHYLSVAQFPNEKAYFEEYDEVCKDIETILLGAFNGTSVTFMEHGSGPSGKTSHQKSIVHEHTHVVVDWKLEPYYKKMVRLQKCEDITEAKDVHYFSYQEGSDGQLMLSANPRTYVQRQFPRQVMAEELNLAPNQYNWRKCEFDENVDATLFHIHNYLKNATDCRICERTRNFVKGYSKRR